jgi:glycerol-3-phosphate dehydrogenase (NAD(P)+)
MSLRIAVLGRGAWGQTLADLWTRQGHQVQSWSRRDGTDPRGALGGVDVVVVAVSLAAIEPLANVLGSDWPSDLPLISCSKGIDLDQLATPTQLWQRRLGPIPLLALSGPNLATELQQGLPAASVLAGLDRDLAGRLQAELSGESLRLYTNQDPIGTEVSGALKNVMAVAAGIADGLQLGANAKASLLCRGLAEIGLVLQGFGGQPETLYGLAGLGDLLATSYSPLSRNYRCGLLLAEGRTEAEAKESLAATVEGPRTARAALRLAEERSCHLPICEQVVAVLDGQSQPSQAVKVLMERDLKPELPR